LTAVTFLCTRLQAATEEDRSKLYRVLGYLKGTREHMLVLHALGENRIMAYVDAAYTIHDDSKSHSGRVLVYAGNALVYPLSKKFESPKSLLGFCNHFLSKWVTPSRQILEG